MISIAKPIIRQKELDAIESVIESGNFAQGPVVKEFENKFAKYIGTKYAIAVNSGTAALHVAIAAAGIKKEVIVPSFTFGSTATSVIHAGAKPVFADVSDDDYNINPESIKQKITDKTEAILPVHLFGQPCDMEKIIELAKENDLIIIEDCCQAHGAEFNEKKVGSFGIGCFSFYPTKNMTTFEGGIITTDNLEIAEKSRMLRNHGCKERYKHEIIGYNFRMTDISAAVGIVQLENLEKWNSKRIENAGYLSENINIPFIEKPVIKEGRKHVFNQYTIKVRNNKRDELSEFLNKKEIGTGIYYPEPLHKQPIFNNNYFLPVSESLCLKILSLPVHAALEKKDMDHIINTLKDFSR
ncbi:MAG: DegT/DnrJ/EryC1/StrS family aminotransferase [Candidatus Aenigmarchaeota archaeon]|nr:DegT/DnrJ/EryC1/StrS family aminotransferase [Candidatus Aenigmarchaeota archaeon]